MKKITRRMPILPVCCVGDKDFEKFCKEHDIARTKEDNTTTCSLGNKILHLNDEEFVAVDGNSISRMSAHYIAEHYDEVHDATKVNKKEAPKKK